ncbi:MAG: ATP-binding protein, partial [Planctomycetaceae bacterium]|nr:ATP-binding protein [Planctomycetaceae bacterium]
GNLTYFNKAYEDLFGYSKEELYGRSALSFANGSDEDHQGFWNILEGKSDFNRVLTTLRAKDGRIVWTDINASVIRSSDPTQTQLITILVDVTERQQILEELHRAKIAAEDANQAKSLFLATMSHEMRTPLNGVIGLSELLMNTALQPKQLEYARLIKTSGNTLLFLINDILDFSKIEAGKFELEDTTFDLHQMVESVLGILSTRADEQQLALALTFGPKVPRPVRGDSGRLRQVLINMVGNGLKFTRQGGVRVQVSAEEIRENDIVVRFEVTDTGVGIPAERMHRLFKPFSQVDASSARQYGGTGLGLSISKKLVELMGGTIGVQSVEGRGSTFWFNVALGCSPGILTCMRLPLPLCVENHSMVCHWNQSDVCPGCGYHAGLDLTLLSGMSALVVCANDIQRQATQTQLDSWGLVAETQFTHADAWESLNTALIRKEPYRLVVIDTDSADCPGSQLIDRIIADDRLANLDIIALVPLTAESENTIYHEKGIRCCRKPVSCSTLFEVVISACLRNLHQSSHAVQVAEIMPRVSLPPASSRRSLKVLVAEDNRINQIVIVDVLHNAGLEVEVVANGREAIDAVQNEPFDIVLMDCQMPQMDGFEATAEIRNWERSQSETRRLPIIALTANATKGDEEKCLRAGMDAYCSKPVNPKRIVELIDQWATEC